MSCLPYRARLLGQCPLDGPSEPTQPGLDQLVPHADSFGPLGQGHGLAPELDDAVVPGVIPLRLRIGPAAIAGLVVAVIVDPIDGVLEGWRLAHVLEERIEGCGPSFADANPPSPIRRIHRRAGLRATGHHLTPDVIDSGSGLAVLGVGLGRPLPPEAAATLDPARPELIGGYLVPIAALALATPDDMTPVAYPLLVRIDRGQPVELLAAQVERDTHDSSPNLPRNLPSPIYQRYS